MRVCRERWRVAVEGSRGLKRRTEGADLERAAAAMRHHAPHHTAAHRRTLCSPTTAASGLQCSVGVDAACVGFG